MSMVQASGYVLADVLERETVRPPLLKDYSISCTIYSLFAEVQFITFITKQ